MAEITDKKKSAKQTPPSESVRIEKGPVDTGEAVQIEGFTSEEVARLVVAKQKIAAGRYSDITNEHKKLLFVQWLIEHDRLKS